MKVILVVWLCLSEWVLEITTFHFSSADGSSVVELPGFHVHLEVWSHLLHSFFHILLVSASFFLTYYKTIHVGLIWDCILACVWGGWRLRSLWLTGGLTPVNTEILNLEKTITEHELLYPRLNKSQPSLHFSKPEWRQAFHILYIHYIIRLCHGADPLISKPSSSLYMTHTQVMESSTQCP